MVSMGFAAHGGEPSKLKTVKAGEIRLRVPETWKISKPDSQLRVAQLNIPSKTRGEEDAELVVYHFGGPTGGIKANIERWVGQFHERGRDVDLFRGNCEQGEYILADISGTWKKPVGPPIAGKTVDKPNSRVMGLILLVGREDATKYYFVKLSGPDELVKSLASTLRTAIGADPKSEQLYNMDEKKVTRSEQEWRKLLTRAQYRVLRMKGTERPFVNKYDKHFAAGTYQCAGCGQELFSSETKFNSGCGWPAFYAAKAGDRVTLTPDNSLGMVRTEVTCSRCDSHLGHVFDDAPQTPTGQRYCINSVAMKFIPVSNKNAKESDDKGKQSDE
jgi:peptide-methionine (R)-S-oxide reductase